jgi:cytochrome c-type biogenesis protein CcmH/NrfF
MSVLFAAYETGAILSWALPLAALLGVVLWWLASWRREVKGK